jgi:hypothetical protein
MVMVDFIRSSIQPDPYWDQDMSGRQVELVSLMDMVLTNGKELVI